MLNSFMSMSSIPFTKRMSLLFSLRGRRFLSDFSAFKEDARINDPSYKFQEFLPCLKDYTAQSAHLPQHYFYQDLFIANRIFENNPVKHVDIGSRVDGFVAHVASFREIEIMDIRPLAINFKNIVFKEGNLMDNQGLEDYCDSISSLHVIEHFGLGRYNDPIDFKGYLTGLDNIYNMLKVGGKFYFSVPVGKERTVFNAHRVFSVKYLMELFQERYRIDSFSYINDKEELVINAPINSNVTDNYLFEYGCGLFELTKLPVSKN
jgi:hypothetical protein